MSVIPTASADSAEPPELTVIVNAAPRDLILSVRFSGGQDAVALEKIKRGPDAYFRLYAYGIPRSISTTDPDPSLGAATLVVQSDEKSFECPLPASAFTTFNNLVTLNLKTETVTVGQTRSRAISLLVMRVVLTLVIEGLIFFAFGYRKKSSWVTFVVTNLITQGALNYLFDRPNLTPFYWLVFEWIPCEIVVFAVEAVAFSLILREFTRKKAVLYALTANLASLILGGVLISLLPV